MNIGVNPQTLRGTKTGVFVACALNEAEIYRTHDSSGFSKYSLLTYCRSLMANFISFAFDLRGKVPFTLTYLIKVFPNWMKSTDTNFQLL